MPGRTRGTRLGLIDGLPAGLSGSGSGQRQKKQGCAQASDFKHVIPAPAVSRLLRSR
jgi:hypothetical protein